MTTPEAKPAMTDSEYLLAMTDTTFKDVPEVKLHYERMRAIAARLAASTSPEALRLAEEVKRLAVRMAQAAVIEERSNAGSGKEGILYRQMSDAIERLAELASPPAQAPDPEGWKSAGWIALAPLKTLHTESKFIAQQWAADGLAVHEVFAARAQASAPPGMRNESP